jgi:Ca-activated chloride channel family protein
MSFLWPSLLILLLIIPVGAAVYMAIDASRRQRAAAYGTLAAPSGGRGRPAGRIRRRIPAACLLLGLGLVVVALARPQAVIGVPRLEGTVMLAFDVSGSMAATDITPTRMEAAKAAAAAFVERQPESVRIGVVSFSDTGFSVQVPTNDSTQVTAAIDRLTPERGTSIARGIAASLSVIAADEAGPGAGYYTTNRGPEPTPEPTPVPEGSFRSAIIVLLTDGENTVAPDPVEAAHAASDRGVRVFPVGIGTAAGATLEVEGFRVHSRLDEPVLRNIAEITHGAYYPVSDPAALDAVYQGVETRLVIRPEPMEVTSLVAGAGMLILLIGAIASLRILGRAP